MNRARTAFRVAFMKHWIFGWMNFVLCIFGLIHALDFPIIHWYQWAGLIQVTGQFCHRLIFFCPFSWIKFLIKERAKSDHSKSTTIKKAFYSFEGDNNKWMLMFVNHSVVGRIMTNVDTLISQFLWLMKPLIGPMDSGYFLYW